MAQMQIALLMQNIMQMPVQVVVQKNGRDVDHVADAESYADCRAELDAYDFAAVSRLSGWRRQLEMFDKLWFIGRSLYP